MYKYLNLIICCGLVANLIGCQSALSSSTQARATTVPLNSSVEQELMQAARSVESSLALLASAQEQVNVPLLNTTPLLTPEGGMSGTADIDWTGPIEPLVQKIAEMTDYKVKVLGNSPSIPIIISISQNNAVLADILKNTGMQAGKRANIVVFPASRVIELRYAKMG